MNERVLLKRIEINPKIMLGKPVIKGTRLTVELIIEKIAYGSTTAEILMQYPFVKEIDIRAALLYAALSLKNEEIYRV
jgi:uncharacterized protein (DUF433 family)